VSTEHSAWTATDAQIEGIAAALRAFGIENVDTLRSSDSGRLIYVQVEQQDGSSLTIGHTYGQTWPTSSEVAAALLEQTFTELDRHMDDPDESPHSSHGMLELTRDRLATVRTLFAGPDLSEPMPVMQALEPAPMPGRPGPARCLTCSEPVRWDRTRQDWTHRNYVAVPHPVMTSAPVPEQQPGEPHEHHFPVLRVLEDGPVIGDCSCGLTFDEYNEQQDADY
jgi:hypothetical protein